MGWPFRPRVTARITARISPTEIYALDATIRALRSHQSRRFYGTLDHAHLSGRKQPVNRRFTPPYQRRVPRLSTASVARFAPGTASHNLSIMFPLSRLVPDSPAWSHFDSPVPRLVMPCTETGSRRTAHTANHPAHLSLNRLLVAKRWKHGRYSDPFRYCICSRAPGRGANGPLSGRRLRWSAGRVSFLLNRGKQGIFCISGPITGVFGRCGRRPVEFCTLSQ